MNGLRWSRETGWVRVDDILPISTTSGNAHGGSGPCPECDSPPVCEDCTTGIPHRQGSIDDVPLWHKGERAAYGAFAELIEMDDEMKHAWD